MAAMNRTQCPIFFSQYVFIFTPQKAIISALTMGARLLNSRSPSAIIICRTVKTRSEQGCKADVVATEEPRGFEATHGIQERVKEAMKQSGNGVHPASAKCRKAFPTLSKGKTNGICGCISNETSCSLLLR